MIFTNSIHTRECASSAYPLQTTGQCCCSGM